MARRLWSLDTPSLLRLGLFGLAALGILGTTIELVFLQHWNGATQQIVWPTLLALLVAFGLILLRPGRYGLATARVILVGVMLVATLGIWFHVRENLDAGPLDRHYAATWATMSPIEQLWDATTGAVGPAPTLAPGALLEISLALLLATLRMPAHGTALLSATIPGTSDA